jgi:hypothetical protein
LDEQKPDEQQPLWKSGTPVERKGWYDRNGRLRGSDVPVPGRCSKQLRGSDPPRFCLRRKLRGFHACRLHYGGVQNGILSANWRHGKFCRDKYDQYLSATMKDSSGSGWMRSLGRRQVSS